MCEQLYLTDDRLLFDKIRGGNAKAFEYAFRKFSPRLEAFAQKYTNDTNEAEDIVQDVLLSKLFKTPSDSRFGTATDTGCRDCRAIIRGGFRT